MTRKLIASISAATAMGLTSLKAAPTSYPPFQEVVDLLRTNLTGFDPAEFNRRATDALLREFAGKWTSPGEKLAPANQPSVAGQSVYERYYPYVRIGQIDQPLEQILATWVTDTNTFAAARGVVIDLRFATGTDYDAAARVAGLFSQPNQPLIDWGEGLRRSSTDTNKSWTLPVAILVNGRTAGAAEALAAVLQQNGSGLVIGSRTAGQAGPLRQFTLSSGQQLQVPIGQIRFGSGEPMPPAGMVPDIEVATRPEHELAWINDPFTPVAASTNSSSATNRIVSSITVRRKVNEAELVRAQKAGKNPDSLLDGATGSTTKPPASTEEAANQAVRDPVLGRALDLLKGLSVIRRR